MTPAPDLAPDPRTRPAAREDVVLTPSERAAVCVLWIVVSGALPVWIWVETGDFADFAQLMIWLFTMAVTARTMARVIGRVDAVAALPPTSQLHPHLPAEYARLLAEAAAIRVELAERGLEPALERAWILCGEFDRAHAAPALPLDRSRAALVPVRELLAVRADPGRVRLSRRQQEARLDAALAKFEASLASPADLGFR